MGVGSPGAKRLAPLSKGFCRGLNPTAPDKEPRVDGRALKLRSQPTYPKKTMTQGRTSASIDILGQTWSETCSLAHGSLSRPAAAGAELDCEFHCEWAGENKR